MRDSNREYASNSPTQEKSPIGIPDNFIKVAWSAMVSCSDLLENDIKCVY